MSAKIILLIISIISTVSFSQEGIGSVQTGPCCDLNGKPNDPNWRMFEPYAVRKFKKKTLVEVKISELIVGQEKIKVDINWKGKIKSETPIIQINKAYGIKITIAQTNENGKNLYLYKQDYFKRDIESNCWRSLFMNIQYNVLNFQSQALTTWSYTFPDGTGQFKIEKGYLIVNELPKIK